MKNRIFIVEDNSFVALDLKKKLMRSNYEVTGIAVSSQSALQKIAEEVPDLVIMDIYLIGDRDGIETAIEIEKKYNIPILYLTSYVDDDTVHRAAATEPVGYLVKPVRSTQLKITIDMAFQKIMAEEKAKRSQMKVQKFSSALKQQSRQINDLQKKYSLISEELKRNIELNLVGRSKAIKKVLHLAELAAQNPTANVLVTGESGTGKEIISRIIHYASVYKDNYFCAVNSSAIPESLLESEFFGHKKGAFTGALENNIGYFEMANNGTLYLDEIGDMPYHLQAKLLRVIETKTIKRIGSQKEIKLNFRVVSSTNKNIYELIEKNRFRLDLLHRLNTIHIDIPPLRDRIEDIAPLLFYYVKKYAREMNVETPDISDRALKELKHYEFPGNVRELKNLVENAMIHRTSNVLKSENFMINNNFFHHKIESKVLKPEYNKISYMINKNDYNIQHHEKVLIEKALKATDGNQTKAAQKLGFSRDTLRRKINLYNIEI